MKRFLLLSIMSALLWQSQLYADEGSGRILDEIGVSRGICVVVGDSGCELSIKLARDSELLIYIQHPRAKEVKSAREAADDAGFYGTRIFVEKGPLERLYLADNTADAVVAVGKRRKISEAEALRVLRPEGKALLGGKVIIKSFPKGVDDWSHPYHGADNNPQSRDRIVRAPYLTHFLAEPRYAPVPQVAVASAGRVFKAFGHVAFKLREEPYLNKLVAFNGYNGAMLWQRELTGGIMVHRNTMIATPTTLYVGDDKSCKVIDTATGRLKDEIIPALETAGGTFWKWMGLEGDVLYALTGEQEQKDPTMRWRREKHGWPWNPISKGFNQPDGIRDSEKAYLTHPWGFGRNVLAIDVKSKNVLWSHREEEPIDSRAMCMKNGRIFIFRFGAYLSCLDAKTGKENWRKTRENAPELFEVLGKYLNRQGASFNWRTTAYLKCSDKALYFAGPPVGQLIAVSTEDGDMLWSYPYGNFQLVLRDEDLYAISGQNDQGKLSKKFEPLTGKVLADLRTGRRACTRPTGTSDAIFYRARGGSTRLDLASGSPQLVSPMRPPCHDGVTIANGLLYWWPSVCDCQLTLYGITCLGPAGEFDFTTIATEEQRLEKGKGRVKKVGGLAESPRDWPTFRADNRCSATTEALVAQKTRLLWQYESKSKLSSSSPALTAPVAVSGLVFVSGPDGIVRSLDAATGNVRWKSYTGGAIRFPPTIWKGRAFVGSGDGWVYCFEAKTGRLLWRFRAAPVERRIAVYGALSSTWPAASGVLVEDGVAYAAAGIVNYDGTYVYALDAVSGKIKWQNNTSGHLDKSARSGVSVQGHLLLHEGKLYLASGNAVSPAVYSTADGKCLNDASAVQQLTQNNVVLSYAPRGSELSLLGDYVVACGKPFYGHPKYEVYDATAFSKVFMASPFRETPRNEKPGTSNSNRDLVWVCNQNSKTVSCFENIDRKQLNKSMSNPRNRFHVDWARLGIRAKTSWRYACDESRAWAVCKNAVLVAGKSELVALDIDDGSKLWSHPLPAAPVVWGLAVDSKGRVIVTLEDGRVLCFGQDSLI